MTRNRLTNIRNENGATTVVVAYDVQGNLANRNGQGFRFDYGNRLREAVGKGSYRYDVDGLRVLATRTDGTAEESLYRRGGPLVYQFNHGSGLQTETLYLDSKAVAQLEKVSGATMVKYLHTDALRILRQAHQSNGGWGQG